MQNELALLHTELRHASMHSVQAPTYKSTNIGQHMVSSMSTITHRHTSTDTNTHTNTDTSKHTKAHIVMGFPRHAWHILRIERHDVPTADKRINGGECSHWKASTGFIRLSIGGIASRLFRCTCSKDRRVRSGVALSNETWKLFEIRNKGRHRRIERWKNGTDDRTIGNSVRWNAV